MDEDKAEHIVRRMAQFICDANAEIMRFTKNKGHIHDTGSEGYVSGYIASRIFSERLLVDDEYVDHVRLEVNVAGRVAETSENSRTTGRFDVVCFDDNGQPLLIVEVKRFFSASALKQDSTRLRSAIEMSRENKGKLKGAVLVGASTDWGKVSRVTAEQQLEKVEETIRDYESNVHTWGGIHQAPIVADNDLGLRSVTGFAVLIKG
jgi:hypothetical protein